MGAIIKLVEKKEHGIFAMRALAEWWDLYDSNGEGLDMQVLLPLFDPDTNPSWSEEDLNKCYIKDFDGVLWKCAWREGDIVAESTNEKKGTSI